ncbi:hypothetical protein OD91_1854 [Lutibacter sp. Hel_I_33_5]|uniref:hypothetical protein n=1 Tax=Lutibacter sp. Hel_I_33_5 TaxID=1566289 RepID=UPI0011A9EDC0|nr:hypothetical protein [Lutibacter sp. Hel_I_33_5]TVZ56565.1 hypothetical protein OD91_1854 [Lutibacter sp. Hel_I_33_5]
MKTIERKILVVVFMLGTLFNYANDKNDFIYTASSKKVKVVFKNVKKGHTLTIKDESGFTLHTENVIAQGNLTKFFDFSSLKDGNYKIELNKDFEILIKPFKVNSNQVNFYKNLEESILKPVIRNEKNLVMISKISFDKTPLKVILYYKDAIIYNETLTNDKIINRVYKLDEKEKGNYSLVILNNNRSYVKNFKI